MKYKLSVTIILGVLTLGFCLVSVYSQSGSSAEKWSSFGLGGCVVFFIGSLISTFNYYSNKKRETVN